MYRQRTRLAARASVVPAHYGTCAVAIKRSVGQIPALSDGDAAIFLPKKAHLQALALPKRSPRVTLIENFASHAAVQEFVDVKPD